MQQESDLTLASSSWAFLTIACNCTSRLNSAWSNFSSIILRLWSNNSSFHFFTSFSCRGEPRVKQAPNRCGFFQGAINTDRGRSGRNTTRYYDPNFGSRFQDWDIKKKGALAKFTLSINFWSFRVFSSRSFSLSCWAFFCFSSCFFFDSAIVLGKEKTRKSEQRKNNAEAAETYRTL